MSDKSCGTCRYLFIAKEGAKPVCRRNPPVKQYLIVPRPSSGNLALAAPTHMIPSEESRSSFPDVMPNWWCGEYAPRVELTS